MVVKNFMVASEVEVHLIWSPTLNPFPLKLISLPAGTSMAVGRDTPVIPSPLFSGTSGSSELQDISPKSGTFRAPIEARPPMPVFTNFLRDCFMQRLH